MRTRPAWAVSLRVVRETWLFIATTSRRSTLKAREIAEQRNTLSVELDSLLKDENGEDRAEFTEEQETRINELLPEIRALDERVKDEKKREKRNKRLQEARTALPVAESRTKDGTDVSVESEPMIYGEGSPHSWVADFCRFAGGPTWGPVDSGVAERMNTWCHQVEREVHEDSKFGRKAQEQVRNLDGVRSENGMHAQTILTELRDRGRVAAEHKLEQRTGLTTGAGATASASGGGGAAFVTPFFTTPDYAPFREPGREFADACNKQQLPPFGLNIYMPRVTAKAGVAQQTEGSGVNENDPTFGYITAPIVTEAGMVIVTQQLLDRVGPNFAFDKMVFDQLQRDLAPNIDTYVLTQALANAGQVPFQGSWAFAAQPGTASFVSKTAGAINAIETTSGTIQSPNSLFVSPSRWNFLESVGALESSSGTLHPLLVPIANGPYNAFVSGNQSGYVPYEGNTGYKLFGLPIYKDLNIPAPTSGADQAIVANTNVVNVYEGPQVPGVIPQTYANNLQVILRLYQYVGVLTQYPTAVQQVTGSALSTITF